MADQPNIVLIFSDQHRGDALGHVGNTAVRTPNLDGLAAEEWFSKTVAPVHRSACLPGRHSLPGSMLMNTAPGEIVTRRIDIVKVM